MIGIIALRRATVAALSDGATLDCFTDVSSPCSTGPSEVACQAQLEELAVVGAEVRIGSVRVVSVTDAAHYGDRAPGAVYMPSTGEVR